MTGDCQPPTRTSEPAVTCLCPTYGRVERLRDAVACFLLQDYANKRLLILNDAPVPLPAAAVRVINRPARYPTLGDKRQVLLELAMTPLVAHWDDDDLYLPWHLSQCVRTLVAHQGAACVKARSAWWAVGPRDSVRVLGVRRNVFEGQMVFERDAALRLGGYPARVSGQAKALLEAFGRAGKLYVWDPPRARISYVYRWSDGVQHISGGGDNRRSHNSFGARNSDFGDGEPLIPSNDPTAWAHARLAHQFTQLRPDLPRLVP